MALEINKIEVLKVPDERSGLSLLTDPARFDGLAPELVDEAKRLDAVRVATYGEDWWFVGVVARAEIKVAGAEQTISSSGLWGEDSDSPDEYFRELGADQLKHLAQILRELGADEDAIVTADKQWFPGG